MSDQQGFVATAPLPPFPFDEVLTFREGPIILSDEGLRRLKDALAAVSLDPKEEGE